MREAAQRGFNSETRCAGRQQGGELIRLTLWDMGLRGVDTTRDMNRQRRGCCGAVCPTCTCVEV